MSQHLEALQLANIVRLRTAHLKRSVSDLPAGDGARRAAEILRSEPDTASLRVDELLLSVRRYGARRVGGLFAEAGITTRLGADASPISRTASGFFSPTFSTMEQGASAAGRTA